MYGKHVGLWVEVVLMVTALAGAPAVGTAGAVASDGQTAELDRSGNEAPLADAGLDQSVRAGQTVRLDATGSRDTDGEIESYNWTITAPNGTTVAPACGSCGRTEFVPAREGRYNVTVTVTDDDGASRSDTLYVRANGTLLSVSLTGPTSPEVGESATYTADLTERRSVERVEWESNRSLDRSTTVDAEWSQQTETLTFADARPRELLVRVHTADGQIDTATLVVRPQQPARTGPGGGAGSRAAGAGGSDDDDGPEGVYNPRANGGEGAWLDEPIDNQEEALANTRTGAERSDNPDLSDAFDRISTIGGDDDRDNSYGNTDSGDEDDGSGNGPSVPFM